MKRYLILLDYIFDYCRQMTKLLNESENENDWERKAKRGVEGFIVVKVDELNLYNSHVHPCVVLDVSKSSLILAHRSYITHRPEDDVMGDG
jgi:hypothetical protein